MNIQLYSTSDEVNTINKTKIRKFECTAIIKGALSLENPVLILQYNNDIHNNINYVYIPDYKRYYFIEDIIALTGGRYEIHCKVDVLESFKSSILNLNCIIDKQEDEAKANKYYNDGSFVASSKEFIYTKNFPNGFNDDGEFILITAGGNS